MTRSGRPVWDCEPVTRPSAPQRQRDAAGRGPSAGSRDTASRARAGARWRAFAGRYGWRAYALPLLSVVTVLAVVNMGSHRDEPQPGAGGRSRAGAPPARRPPRRHAPRPARPAAGRPPAARARPARRPAARRSALRSWQLPPGPAYTFSGTGTFSTVAGPSGRARQGPAVPVHHRCRERHHRRRPARSFAATVMAALSDQRSWIGSGAVALQRVDSGPVDFRISLAAPTTVRTHLRLLAARSRPPATPAAWAG